ncbi:MAG: isoleucyl-tRNA synthetase [Candidatus Azotimanducaceae bacterium]|jgi:isoleucyl-tRNA synthetase
MNTNDAEGLEKSEVALREEAVLEFWKEHDIFNKSIQKEAPKGDFVFYDGPPFATGLPHYGHILAGTIKDAIPRFWTMNGYRVKRKWGWDCHGLPLENLIEKKLGLGTKRDIEEYGVQNFNEAARDAVLEYADDWKEIIPRMGRWADMENDYKTMDSSYTESVWWVFKQLHEKGLVYEGFKSMHLCPRCGTTLSNFEVNQGYKDIKDIAVTVKLGLLDEKGEVTDTSLLVWTTTPWTLPGNMAAAVHNEHEYVKVEVQTDEGVEKVILAKGRLAQLGDLEYKIIEEMKGADLVGKSYVPPFDYSLDKELEGKENAWKIYHADYVELGEEGTGAVHLAPAYGEDDMNLGKEHGVPIVHHVDNEGHFMSHVVDFAGVLVKPKDDDDAGVTHLDADIEIVKALKANGTLFKKDNITHSYPHCWRCDTPLLNYATTSWFVEVTKIKDKLVAENKKVKWVPEHVGRARFGKWLEGARDWAVSRQRYWGAPLPIWRNPETKEYKVFGSLAELQEYVPKSGNQYFLMRHGESESNAGGFSSTKINAANPVTQKGIAQIKSAIPELQTKDIDLIIASPFQRTKETAALVAEGLGMADDQIVYDDRAGEIQLGSMDGVSFDEYHAFLDSGGAWCDCAPDGGESWDDVKRRMGSLLYDIETKYKGKKILIIAHNSPLRMLGAINDGIPLLGSAFDHDEDGQRYGNAEVRELPFTPMPHNDNYELDYHRPYIDDIELFEEGVKLERVPDVFDCWFESGSMPYGQHHHPFEHADTFEKEHFPAQFIAESVDQTRGWFYSMMVLGVALFGKSSYENVITNGLVLAEDGKKMSKSLQNYPDPMYIANTLGADSMRFYLLSSSIMKGEDLNFSEKEVLELQRKNIGRLHNVLAMYEQFADGTNCISDSEHVLDRWIMARSNELTKEATQGFKNYEIDKATRPVTDFIDDLSVWYLRRSRDRLKGTDVEDKKLALGTLRYVLQNLSLVIAPSMPFYAEYLWGKVKDDTDEESVHLSRWPEAGVVDETILEAMHEVRRVVSEALEIRAKNNVKVRQPLSEMTFGSQVASMDETMFFLIQEEINVKEIRKISEEQTAAALDLTITPELKAEGDSRDFIRAIQDMRKKEGLQASDRITLTITTPEEGRSLLNGFLDEIQKTVGAQSIIFADTDGQEIKVGDNTFTVSIAKM